MTGKGMKGLKIVSIFALAVSVLAAMGTLTPCSPQEEKTVKANLIIKPEILDLQSKDRFITCFLEMPAEIKVSDIMPNRIILSNVGGYAAYIKPAEYTITDNNGDGASKMILKYRRFELTSAIMYHNLPGQIRVSVTGRLRNNTPFIASDSIRVVNLSTAKDNQAEKYMLFLPLLLLPAY